MMDDAVMTSSDVERMNQTIRKATEMTDPKFSLIRTVDIQRRANGPWYTVEVNMIEMLQILQTGEYDEEKVTAVRIYQMEVENEAEDKVYLIYDFINLHTEKNPWRML